MLRLGDFLSLWERGPPHRSPLPLGEGPGVRAKQCELRSMINQVESLPAELLAFARELRQRHTDAEKLLWALLRNRGLGGFKFRRQHPVDPYVLDFYCAEKRLGIELDGAQHEGPQATCPDERRTARLLKQGIRVVRFPNQDVLADTQSVLKTIWCALHRESLAPALSHEDREQGTLTPSPSPSGRGEQGT
jgi:very-short-patch-repair endonuclease